MATARPILGCSAAAFLSALALASLPPRAAEGPLSTAAAKKEMRALLDRAFPAGEPGAAVIVVKGGQVLLREGRGLADAELGVAAAPGHLFRIGSLTKQFTAVGLLLLAEEGKLALADPVTKYVDGLAEAYGKVTLAHLLSHTGGVPSYTDLPGWQKLWRTDLSLAELLGLTRDLPLDFAPGARWKYSNTGYLLLGAVIERASGLDYAEFVRRRIAEPLALRRTMYDETERLVPGRAKGYVRAGEAWAPAPYLSMTHPLSAGGLLSTVDDLAAWEAALQAGRLLPLPALARARTPVELADGQASGYGFGWAIDLLEGRPTAEHGGGIPGFTSYALSVPSERLFVAVLTNRAAPSPSPSQVATDLATLALARKPSPVAPVALKPGELEDYPGVYASAGAATRFVRLERDGLTALREGGETRALVPLGKDLFAVKGFEQLRLAFTRDAAGKVAAVRIGARGPAEVLLRTSQPLPAEPTPAPVEAAVLPRLAGRYELAPGFVLAVTVEDGRLFAQATGQRRLELHPERPDLWFYRAVDAKVEFLLGPEGPASGIVLHQGGKHAGKRLP